MIGHAGGGGHRSQRVGDLQGVGAGFDLAGAGDQGERQVVADLDLADAHCAMGGRRSVVVHGACSFTPRRIYSNRPCATARCGAS